MGITLARGRTCLKVASKTLFLLDGITDQLYLWIGVIGEPDDYKHNQLGGCVDKSRLKVSQY